MANPHGRPLVHGDSPEAKKFLDYIETRTPTITLAPREKTFRDGSRSRRPAGSRTRGGISLRDNPLPAVHGRVCYHPCESSCNRRQLDAAVSIHAVERFLGDRAREAGWKVVPDAPLSGRRVLVVGAGRAGSRPRTTSRASAMPSRSVRRDPLPAACGPSASLRIAFRARCSPTRCAMPRRSSRSCALTPRSVQSSTSRPRLDGAPATFKSAQARHQSRAHRAAPRFGPSEPGVLRGHSRQRPLTRRLLDGARHAVPRAPLRVLRRVRGLRRDAVPEASLGSSATACSWRTRPGARRSTEGTCPPRRGR